MDILAIVQYGMFVPFVFVLLLFGIIYLMNGYKKDLGNSLISLVATILTTVVSLLLAKGVGLLVSKPLLALLPAEVSEVLAELGPFSSFGESFIKGGIEVVVSFLLFGFFFLVCLAIFKTVGKKISWEKLENLNSGETGTRLAGLGIRGIDAVLVTIMLLLPLYGTIAMVAPPVATIIEMSESFAAPQARSVSYEEYEEPEYEANGEEVEIIDLVEIVANHPVLAPYKYGPGDWVYSGLSSFSMNGKTVDIASAADSLEGLLDRVQVCLDAFEAQDADALVVALQDAISYTRDEVIHQRWSYNMVMAFVGEMDGIVAEFAGEFQEEAEMLEFYEQAKPLLNMTFEEYTYNAEGILDFAEWALNTYGKYINTPPTDEEFEPMAMDLYAHIGDLLNYSEQAVGLKRIILQMYAETMFEVLPDANNPEYADYYAARKDLPNSGAAFINKYFGDGIVPQENRVAETIAFISLINCQNPLDIAEAFTRHPSFGADAVLYAMDEYLYINSYPSLGKQLAESSKAEKTYKKFDNMLKECEEQDLNDGQYFSDRVYSYLAYELGFEDYDLYQVGGMGEIYYSDSYDTGYYESEQIIGSSGAVGLVAVG